jgi:membrane-associated phospholipid phosphatase
LSNFAEFLGEHAVEMLIAFSILMLLLTGIAWRLIQRFGPALWKLIARLWTFAARSPVGDYVLRVPGMRGTFARGLSIWRYLGIHAVISFVVAAVALVAFVELADEIDVNEEFAMFDATLTQSLEAHLDPPTLELFATITHLGDREVTIIFGVIVGLYFLARKWWLHAAIWTLATGGGGILVRILKAQFERTRPIHEHALTDSTGWSFPSGHASGSMLVYGMLSYIVIRHTPSVWHIPIAMLAIIVVVFVGFSRVILQVHYLSDVLAGFAVASAWLALSIAALEAIKLRSRQTAVQEPPL